MVEFDLTLTLDSQNELLYTDICEHHYSRCQKEPKCYFVLCHNVNGEDANIPGDKMSVYYVYVNKRNDVIEKDWLREFDALIEKNRRQILSTVSSLNSTF